MSVSRKSTGLLRNGNRVVKCQNREMLTGLCRVAGVALRPRVVAPGLVSSETWRLMPRNTRHVNRRGKHTQDSVANAVTYIVLCVSRPPPPNAQGAVLRCCRLHSCSRGTPELQAGALCLVRRGVGEPPFTTWHFGLLCSLLLRIPQWPGLYLANSTPTKQLPYSCAGVVCPLDRAVATGAEVELVPPS